jgi:hypothetical protein
MCKSFLRFLLLCGSISFVSSCSQNKPENHDVVATPPAEEANQQEAGDKANQQKAGDKANQQEAGDKANQQEAGDKANQQEAGDKANQQEAGDKASQQGNISEKNILEGENTQNNDQELKEKPNQKYWSWISSFGETWGAFFSHEYART